VNFYLMRHGDAVSALENPQRPLSKEGCRRVEQTARMALQRNIEVSLVYHSGILRAMETAEILAAHLARNVRIAPLSGLLPEDDPTLVQAELDAASNSILLVGHLPFMGRLAGLLVAGDPDRPVVDFAPATMVCCVRAAAQWQIDWQITPPYERGWS